PTLGGRGLVFASLVALCVLPTLALMPMGTRLLVASGWPQPSEYPFAIFFGSFACATVSAVLVPIALVIATVRRRAIDWIVRGVGADRGGRGAGGLGGARVARARGRRSMAGCRAGRRLARCVRCRAERERDERERHDAPRARRDRAELRLRASHRRGERAARV